MGLRLVNVIPTIRTGLLADFVDRDLYLMSAGAELMTGSWSRLRPRQPATAVPALFGKR